MRSTVTFTLLLVVLSTHFLSLTTASTLNGLPACAQPCAFNGTRAASCSNTDYPCICKSKAFWDFVPFCVLTTCLPNDQNTSLTLASKICANAGVPLDSTIASEIAAALSSDLASLASGLAAAATGIGGLVSSALAITTTSTKAAAATTTAAASPTKAASQAVKGEVHTGAFWLALAGVMGVVGVGVLL